MDPFVRDAAKWFVQYLQRQGLTVTVTSARRSSSEQARLYRLYLAGKSRWPAARPGTSLHERGLAFDAVVRPEQYQSYAGEVWEAIGGRWGGRFNDDVHFEVRRS